MCRGPEKSWLPRATALDRKRNEAPQRLLLKRCLTSRRDTDRHELFWRERGIALALNAPAQQLARPTHVNASPPNPTWRRRRPRCAKNIEACPICADRAWRRPRTSGLFRMRRAATPPISARPRCRAENVCPPRDSQAAASLRRRRDERRSFLLSFASSVGTSRQAI